MNEYILPTESYGDPMVSHKNNTGPYIHLVILLSDVKLRDINVDNFVVPLSIWKNYPMNISYNEKCDMIESGMTGGEQL